MKLPRWFTLSSHPSLIKKSTYNVNSPNNYHAMPLINNNNHKAVTLYNCWLDCKANSVQSAYRKLPFFHNFNSVTWGDAWSICKHARVRAHTHIHTHTTLVLYKKIPYFFTLVAWKWHKTSYPNTRQIIYRLEWCSGLHPDKFCTQSSSLFPPLEARPRFSSSLRFQLHEHFIQSYSLRPSLETMRIVQRLKDF